MKKLKRHRQTLRPVTACPYTNLVADVIIDAIMVATCQAIGNDYDRTLATQLGWGSGDKLGCDKRASGD